jgi:hypothetical protein
MKTHFQKYAMDGGLITKKWRVSLERLPREGVSSNLGHRFKNGRLLSSQRKPGGTVAVLFSLTAAPWPATHRSNQVSFPIHCLTRDPYQSTEKLKAISPDAEMKAKTARFNRTAPKGGRPSSYSRWRHKNHLATKLKHLDVHRSTL